MKIIALIFLLILTSQDAHASESEVIYGKASWYSSKDACGPKTNPHPKCPTADGSSLFSLENSKEDFAASWIYRLGSFVRVTNVDNQKSVLVKIVDRGPAKRLNRPIDLGKHSFAKIADLRKGITQVKIEPIK